MQKATRRWRHWAGMASIVLQLVIPGAVLFALLVWLSIRFVTEGFGDVRQHAFESIGGKWSFAAGSHRNWWSCTCAVICACLSATGLATRRCCAQVFDARAMMLAG